MDRRKREGSGKEKRRGSNPDEIAAERGEFPEDHEANSDEQSTDIPDGTDFKINRRERRRDRRE